MKNIINIISIVALVAFTSCSDSGETPKQDATTKLLTASSWGHATVTHSDGDLSDQYQNFMIIFTDNELNGYDGSFLVSNGGNAFSEGIGKWKFNDDKTLIILDSEKEIEFTVTENILQLEFTVPSSGGKAAGLSGHFVFELQHL